MSMRAIARKGLLAGFVLACATAQAGNILLNGDFQTGDLTSWTPFTTSSNGTNGASLPDVVSFNTTGSGATDAAQFDVGEISYTGLPEGGGLTQTFTLGSGGSYMVFANIASTSGFFNADAGTFSILIDGSLVVSDDLGQIATAGDVDLGTLDGSVSLTSGVHTFEILITRDYDSAGAATPSEYIDNVSLSASGSSTPEPGTFALVALALIGIGLHRRRSGRG